MNSWNVLFLLCYYSSVRPSVPVGGWGTIGLTALVGLQGSGQPNNYETPPPPPPTTTTTTRKAGLLNNVVQHPQLALYIPAGHWPCAGGHGIHTLSIGQQIELCFHASTLTHSMSCVCEFTRDPVVTLIII